MRTMIVFFFQAEDGIRDVAVTGVQTCALPISRSRRSRARARLRWPRRGARGRTDRSPPTGSGTHPARPDPGPARAGPPAVARETRPVPGALPTSWPILDLTPAAGRWRVAAIRTSDAKPAFLASPSVRLASWRVHTRAGAMPPRNVRLAHNIAFLCPFR